MEQWTSSKLVKEYVKSVCHHPAHLTSMWSLSQNAGLDESQAGIRMARRNINSLIYAYNTTLMAEGQEELKSLLMRMKEESKQA